MLHSKTQNTKRFFKLNLGHVNLPTSGVLDIAVAVVVVVLKKLFYKKYF